jgi:hypothetical protein
MFYPENYKNNAICSVLIQEKLNRLLCLVSKPTKDLATSTLENIGMVFLK